MNNRLMYYLGLCFFAFLFLFPRTEVQAEENKGSATFIYGDREVTVAGLKRAWGFTPLIKYDGKTILFNTGGKEEILKHNFQVLGIEPKDLDAVVISHEHWEMYEAIGFIVEENNKIPIYTTDVVIQLLREKNPAWEANLRSVSRFVQFTPSIYFQNLRSGRRRGGPHGIDEVHIVLKTDRGLVIFQGCGHPQILHIVKKSKSYTGVDKVHLVAGGTRLLRPGTHVYIEDSGENVSPPQKNYYSDEYYDQLMIDLKKEGVEYVMPTHCTQEPAESFFRKSFGDKYIRQTLGMTLTFPID
ncbi:MAG: MBL fold metallo-hydrolase [Desulfobacterales bacterium]|nr:MBL fold metallo-hydrolase [Desulfobacterales bacterium]